MDYWTSLDLYEYEDWEDFWNSKNRPKKIYLLTTHADNSIWEAEFQAGDGLLFGNEGHGTPKHIHDSADYRIRIPKFKDNLRSLNLAVSVGIATYEGASADKPLNRSAVSIILPYRNASKTILRCIKSIQLQTLKNWELLAINDQSTDTTEKKIQSLLNNDPRVKYYSTQKPGIVSALNLGIERASSDLMARMDSDDVMHPLRLEKQVGFLERHPEIGVLASKVCYKVNHGEPYGGGYEKYVEWSNSILEEYEISLYRFEESTIIHPSVVFRKILFNEYGGYRDGPFPEDYELWLRWQSKG